MSEQPEPFWGSDAASQEHVRAMQEQLLNAGGPARIFGEPVSAAGQTIITAGESVTVYGYGNGRGGSVSGDKSDGGSGGGGGGYTFSRPVAVVIVGERGVRLEPIMDVTKVSLAFFTALAAMVASLARMKRRK